MKQLITILLCLFTLFAEAQVNPNDTNKYFKSYDYGFSYRRLQAREAFIMPTDTVINKLGAVSLNGAIYLGNGIKWTLIGGGGGSSTDTTSLSNRINLKIDSLKRSNDSVYAYRNGTRVFQFKDSVGGGGVAGSGTQNFLPKWSNSTTLTNSQIFDSVNVGIGTITPLYKLDVVNANFPQSNYARFSNQANSNKNAITFGKSTSAAMAICDSFGLVKVLIGDGSTGNVNFLTYNDNIFNFGYSNAIGGLKLPSSLIKFTSDFNYTSGTNNHTILNINPNINVTGSTNTLRGIYYNPNNTTGTIQNEIAFENTQGDIIHKNLATTGADQMVTIDSLGKLKRQAIPTGGLSDTIYTQNPIMYITRNDSNIIFFNADTANAWRNTTTANDTAKVVIAQVYNATATTLLKGEVVYLFGSNGNVASVKRANNKQDSTSSKTFGLVRRDIPAGSTGFVTTQGQIEKLNLGSYVEGDVLWLDSLDGQFTKVKPQGPYHGVFLGVVERANNGNGLAYIKPQNGVELDEVHDVQINNLVNNQIIVYSDTQKVWKNRSINSLIDTTLFQRKSLPANSFLANNTNAAANATAQAFKDTSGTYTGTITWNGVAPTSGNFSYRFTRIGKMVTINISLIYAVAGSANSTLIVTLPTDAPTPTKPAGLTSASNLLYPCYGNVNGTGSTTLTSSVFRGALRSNSANTGFEFFIGYTLTTPINANFTCIYFTD